MSKKAKISAPGGGRSGGPASDVSGFLVKNGWKVIGYDNNGRHGGKK